MLFLNPWLLIGLVSVLIPMILHLVRKHAARPYKWGAMRFLINTMVARRRSVEWEDVLLMATRCLLISLIALALARPYVSPNSQIPWFIILPLCLAGLVGVGVSLVMSSLRWRWLLRGLSLVFVLVGAGMIWWEEDLKLQRFQTSARRDVALVIDGSSSMMMARGNSNAFERSVEDARQLVREAPRGTAFSVILGGPAPELKTGTPLTRRTDVLDVLDSLTPVGGPFHAFDALGVATLSLAEGRGSTKDIIVLSDGQRLGWKLEEPPEWSEIGKVWSQFENAPRLLTHHAAPSGNIRNVAVTGIELSREVVGLDRPVVVRAVLENTGTEVISPGEVVFTPGNLKEVRKGVSQLIPGEQVIVEFEVLFQEEGPQVIKVEIDGEDDLLADDLAEKVVIIKKNISVLLVDGNLEADFFDRATGYVSLALAPTSGAGPWMMSPRVVDSVALASEDLAETGVIVLADVSRLPRESARKVEDFILRGGGLLVLAGDRIEPEFYQNWKGGNGQVMPCVLGDLVVPERGVTIAPASFDDSFLKGMGTTSFRSASIVAYRKAEALQERAVVLGRYGNGEIFLAAQEYGRGRVMFSSCSWDARLGSLPVHPEFVPLVHETISWLAAGTDLNLNVKASWSPSISYESGPGLRGRYSIREQDQWKVVMDRVDPVIGFDLKNDGLTPGMSWENFRITWEGELLPPETGKYRFEAATDGRLTMSLDGEEVLRARYNEARSGEIRLRKNQPVSLRLSYEQDAKDAKLIFRWQKPDGSQERVPSSVLFPMAQTGGTQLISETKALDPTGKERTVQAVQRRKGRTLEISATASPGRYQVEVPRVMHHEVPFSKVPLVVTRDVRESRYEKWNADDRKLIRREIDLIELRTAEDALAVFQGKGFGRELWQILAMCALFIFFLEGLLARWVSKSRKVGVETQIDFENRDEMSEAFLEAAKEVKG